MKTTHPGPDILQLNSLFQQCAPDFKATLDRIAQVADSTALQVFALWRTYSAECHAGDQSPILGEFIEWYGRQLGNNPDALRAAITS